MSIRGELMDEAKRLTEGDRNETHGDPTANMRVYGELLAILGEFVLPDSVQGAMAACMHKMARIMQNPGHRDSYVDLIAYVGIAGEAAEKEGLFDPLNSETALDTKPGALNFVDTKGFTAKTYCSLCGKKDHKGPCYNVVNALISPDDRMQPWCLVCGKSGHMHTECERVVT